ncbi:hypothetical protein ACHAWF_004293 [Thalassiosira exigua]
MMSVDTALVASSTSFPSPEIAPAAFVRALPPDRSPPARLSAAVVVVGDAHEALAAAMATCARDALAEEEAGDRSGTSRSVAGGGPRSSPIPPTGSIAFFNAKDPAGEEPGSSRRRRRSALLPSETLSSLRNAVLFLGQSTGDYGEMLAASNEAFSTPGSDATDSDDRPMLHAGIDLGSDAGSGAMESIAAARDDFSFLGLNLKADRSPPDGGGFSMSRERADVLGNELRALLEGRGPSSAAATMDVRTHLALLQANALPRTRGALGANDVWAVGDTIRDGRRVDEGGGMLFEYEYDYSDPFGGCDPLLRPSTGYVAPSPTAGMIPRGTRNEANDDAFASAYSVLMGSGADAPSSLCVATGVKAAFGHLGRTESDGVFRAPPYTWDTIDCIAEFSLRSRQSMTQESGLSRKMYKEFGYR